MEGMGRQFVVGWTEGKDLCLYQASSIRTQSQNLNRKLNRGGNISRALLAPRRKFCTRFAECECARAIWFGFGPQFYPVDMVEIISLRQGGAAASRSQCGNSIVYFQSSCRSSAKEISNASSDDFSKSLTRRSFSLARSAVPKQPDPDLAGALQSRRKSSSTAIREENSSRLTRSNILGNAVLWNAKKSDSSEQQQKSVVEKTIDPSIASYEAQVLHTALISSHRAAGSSSSAESSSISVESSPFTAHRKTLRASTQSNLSWVPKLKSGGGSSLFTSHKNSSAGRSLVPSEASSTCSAKEFQSVRNSEEYARRTDATEVSNFAKLSPSREESPRRIANSSASMGRSAVNFPSSSTTAKSSEKIEQAPSTSERTQKRIPSPARSPRSSRKDHGQAFLSSESLDRLHQQLEEQAKDNSSKAILQKPLGPEESARLRERLKEQKQKSIREIHRRLFQNRRQDGQGDEFSCAVEPDSLILGEFVVHKRVGVGKYIGMKSEIPPGKANPSMYIYLKYADGIAKLKAKQAHRLLYRYHLPGDIGGAPSLSKLKDPSSWEKRKNKGKIAIQKMVINMMELYIHRLKQSRHPYPRNPLAMAKFAAKFPHTPTPDQLQAFADVERDLTELDLPMDRLICGDVGFGKTEVALRALFIAVEAGKQVMVLTPSTVLAKQHYETVRDRFASFPAVKVALLCRFQKESQRKDLIAGIHDGSLDIVVGTHSLLGSQIRYNNLGLLVIDEEQRFGVKQKEKITCLKTSVDVLTLSATPIPRTLYLAMSGFRDASLLTTPPPERRPIQTHLIEHNEEQVRKAIQFELDRGGQVFYVVPKVKGIDMLQKTLQSHFPDVKVAIAHGKQSASVLEESMERFCEGDTKILLCTNIIESGLDIRMVNTIIVEDVHLFGLAQLYQLRGRVGRAQREAYAYLLHPDKSLLTDEALERLVALQDCCDLGQGFQLAERDMAIRGIGSLFGEQQSGDAAKIGTDLYFEMLLDGLSKVDSQRLPQVQYEDVQVMKIKQLQKTALTWFLDFISQQQMDLGVDTHIPSEYIKSPEEREAAIRAAENAARESLRTLMLFTNRLRDRYGKEPASMEMLLKTIYVRRMAADLGINRIRIQGTSVLMETNMTVDAFEIIKTSIPSDSIRSSLTFESGRIEMQGLIGLPKERQLERVFCCLADMFNGLPSFVKYI